MNQRNTALCVFLLSYLLNYPDDIRDVTQPLATILELSNALSPWLYMVLAVSIVTWGLMKVLRPGSQPERPISS